MAILLEDKEKINKKVQNRDMQTNEEHSGGKLNTALYFLCYFIVTGGHLGRGRRCKTSKRKHVFPAWALEHFFMRQ